MHLLGRILLLGALPLASLTAMMALIGARLGDERAARIGRRGMLAVWAMILAASAILLHALLSHDFSNEYVVGYSDRKMPWYYVVAAFWGGQKGSLLFWAFILTSCGALAVRRVGDAESPLVPYAIAGVLAVFGFFDLILIQLADPFEQFLVLGTLADGEGLNPLLQNPTMTFHPPTILAGYAVWAVPFGVAVGALVTGRLDDGWVKLVRPWALAGWFLLALGNLFGAWWAYEELGWGGYWGWDPVENASLLPWLTSTAYLHSVFGQERRRGLLRVWSVSLLFATFVLTIFGTFLTRTGLVQSVHAFADGGPLKLYFLVALGVLIVLCIGLVVWRLPLLRGERRVESLLSREAALVGVNVLFVVAVVVVLWGTMFPTVNRWLTGREMVIGPDWFNRFMAPVGVAILALTALGPRLAWGGTQPAALLRRLIAPGLAAAVSVGALLGLVWRRHWWAAADLDLGQGLAILTLFLAAFVVIDVAFELVRSTRARAASAGLSAALRVELVEQRRRFGGYLVHAGVALLFVGFAGSAFKVEQEVRVRKGEPLTVGDYTLHFQGLSEEQHADKLVVLARLDVDRGGKRYGVLGPARHLHKNRQRSTTTEVDYQIGPVEDLYVALVGLSQSGEEASLKVVVNPLLLWMYVGTFLLTLGAAVALGLGRVLEPRRAAARRRSAPSTVRETHSQPASAARTAGQEVGR